MVGKLSTKTYLYLSTQKMFWYYSKGDQMKTVYSTITIGTIMWFCLLALVQVIAGPDPDKMPNKSLTTGMLHAKPFYGHNQVDQLDRLEGLDD